MAGIFPTTAMMAHSCIPNVSHIVDEQYRVTIMAAVSIPKGHVLYVSYTHTLQGNNLNRFF